MRAWAAVTATAVVVLALAGCAPTAPAPRARTVQLDFRPVIATAEQGDASMDPAAAGPTYDPHPTASPTDASDPNWVSEELMHEYADFDCGSLRSLDPAAVPDDQPFISCGLDDGAKYLLGPVEVSGRRITKATAGRVAGSDGGATDVWGVMLTFDPEGTEEFAAVTTRLSGYDWASDPRNRFAIVEDGVVISAPTTNAVITDGKAQITGSFTEESAKRLAAALGRLTRRMDPPPLAYN